MPAENIIDINIGDPYVFKVLPMIRKIAWCQPFFSVSEVLEKFRESKIAFIASGENQCMYFY